MSSPIQNLIGIGAAGASPIVLGNGATRPPAGLSPTTNPAIQQIIATQAALGVTLPGKPRITDNKEKVDASFDSERKESKSEEQSEEVEFNHKPKHDGKLDVLV